VVVVEGVVTAEAGRLGIAQVVAIQDATAAIAVRLPDAYASVARGTRLRVTGVTAAPYGQLEIRSVTEVVVLGDASIPPAIEVAPGEIGEDFESRLVAILGTIDTAVSRSASGDLSFDVVSDDGRARIVADATSALAKADVARNATYDFVGVVGQRESKKGRNDGYRVWLRDIHDVELVAKPAPIPTPKPSSTTKPTGTPSRVTIAKALLTSGSVVRVEGRVTAAATLLDATGRRIVIQDATAAIEVYLPAGSAAPSVGTGARVDGKVVRAYGAPRLRATATSAATAIPAIRPLALGAAPSAAHEWRLVTLSGTVTDVRRLGDRWRAEISVGSARVPIAGLPGSGIAATALVEGHHATLIGIVKRASPGAADRRLAVVPRSAADIELGSAASRPAAPPSAAAGRAAEEPAGASTGIGATSVLDIDIATLGDHVGAVVRVGGLVVSLQPDGATLDDGTATGRIVLRGPAADFLPLLEEGDAINATGTVERHGEEIAVAVTDGAGIASVGDPTSADPSGIREPSPAAGLPQATVAASAGPLGPLNLPGAGLATVLLLSLSSATMTLLLRRGARARVVDVGARLRGLAARRRDAGG
jgi:hypothetical protein